MYKKIQRNYFHKVRGVSNQSKLPTRFINLKIFRDFKSLEKLEYTGKYTLNKISHYILVIEYTKTRIYAKYTELFESKDLRF